MTISNLIDWKYKPEQKAPKQFVWIFESVWIFKFTRIEKPEIPYNGKNFERKNFPYEENGLIKLLNNVLIY